MKPKPPLTREELKSAIRSGHAPQWEFFWGHTPAKDGSITKACFSQWWAGHPFVVQDVRYMTAEHFMMAEKARLFCDTETVERILAARTPAEAKKLGRSVRRFDDQEWMSHRWSIVVRGNIAKFSQHSDLRQFLLETGQRVIVEASPVDQVWGIGMAATDPNAGRPECWKGLNLLGFALMEVRNHLQTQT